MGSEFSEYSLQAYIAGAQEIKCVLHTVVTGCHNCPYCVWKDLSTAFCRISESDLETTSFAISHKAPMKPYCKLNELSLLTVEGL
jgi:hypothetical protein